MSVPTLRIKAQEKYIAGGFVLVKLRPNSKKPLERNWSSLPFRKNFRYNHNFGVVLQHDHIIIDVDPRNFKDGTDSFEKLREKVGGLPRTFVVQTGAGGFHYYFKKPASLVTIKKHPDYPGVEFLSKGKHIVGPGSIHPDTKMMYKPFDNTKLKDIVDAPDSLLSILAEVYEQSGAPRHRQAKYTENEATITRYQYYLQTSDGAVQGEQGDEKCRRFTGPRLCLACQIFARQGDRQGLGLDGGATLKTRILDTFKHGFGNGK